MTTKIDKNCLSYWYRRLPESVRTPKTHITELLIEDGMELVNVLDGNKPPQWDALIETLKRDGDDVGYPCFLRTGQGSGKHEWQRTCFVESANEFSGCVCQLVEWSNLVDIVGLPHNVWVVRRMLPVDLMFYAFGGMPITRERRLFVRNGEILCMHPYWPLPSIEFRQHKLVPTGWKDILERDNGITTKVSDIERIAREVSAAPELCDDVWSMDLLWSGGEWWLTDMALAAQSFHWPGCREAGVA